MSVFAKLFNYRRREARSPAEDFLTEAFAGVLDSSCALRTAYVKFLAQLDRQMKTVRVMTQYHTAYGRPDLVLDASDSRGSRHVVTLEHKIDAPEGDLQLSKYASWLKTQDAATRTLVFITRHWATPRIDDPDITLRTLRWPEVYDWLSVWERDNRECKGGVLATELLSLIEDWRLTMTLSAHDLAAAVSYRNSIENTLYQILNEVWNRSSVRGTQDNKWSYSVEEYKSPRIDGGFRFQYGFDFSREDEHWNVARLALPSAYFAVWAGDDETAWERPCGWTAPPSQWGWEEGFARRCSVTQIQELVARDDSLHGGYLAFFLGGLAEAERAVGLKPSVAQGGEVATA